MNPAYYNQLLAPARGWEPPDDFTRRLVTQQRVPAQYADPSMVVSPYMDPGYAMPNALPENLNQMPGTQIGGWLPVNATNPNATDSYLPQDMNRLLAWWLSGAQ